MWGEGKGSSIEGLKRVGKMAWWNAGLTGTRTCLLVQGPADWSYWCGDLPVGLTGTR